MVSNSPLSVKQRLAAGHSVCGTFIQLGAPGAVEALAAAGFDFLIVDTEHAPLDRGAMVSLVRAVQGAGATAVVRAPTEEIGQCLDAGAEGVLVPRITSLAAARAAAAATRYAPVGTRGACPGVRAQRYGAVAWSTYVAQAADHCLLVLALEGPEALTLADQVLALPGVDVVFIGAFDLSQALGYPGQPMHPMVTSALEQMVQHATSAGKAVGTWAPTPADIVMRRQAGARFLTVSSDALLLFDAARLCMQTVWAERQTTTTTDKTGKTEP